MQHLKMIRNFNGKCFCRYCCWWIMCRVPGVHLRICRNCHSRYTRYMLPAFFDDWNIVRVHFGFCRMHLENIELVLFSTSNFKFDWPMLYSRESHMAAQKCMYCNAHQNNLLDFYSYILVCSVEMRKPLQQLNFIGVDSAMQIMQFKP